MTLRLTPAGLEDVQLLAQMNRDLIADEGSRNPMSEPQLRERMMAWLETVWQADILWMEEEVIGYALYQLRAHPFHPEVQEVYLRQYFIGRDYRGRGYGLAGIQLLKQTRFQEAHTLIIDVLESNLGGKRFWQKAGFTPYYINMRMEL